MVYATVPQLRSQMSISDEIDDGLLYAALAAATSWVDNRCGRTFGSATVPTARTYYSDGCTVWPDDIASTTGLIVSSGQPGAYTSTLVQDTSFYLYPANAIALGRPITELRGSFPASWRYPTVQVTALWGWPVVPADVVMATLLMASRLFKRKDSPEGVSGFGEFGAVRVPTNDPDIERLLAPYTRPGIA